MAIHSRQSVGVAGRFGLTSNEAVEFACGLPEVGQLEGGPGGRRQAKFVAELGHDAGLFRNDAQPRIFRQSALAGPNDVFETWLLNFARRTPMDRPRSAECCEMKAVQSRINARRHRALNDLDARLRIVCEMLRRERFAEAFDAIRRGAFRDCRRAAVIGSILVVVLAFPSNYPFLQTAPNVPLHGDSRRPNRISFDTPGGYESGHMRGLATCRM